MEQVITAIESVKGSRKRRIYVNDEWKFSLYPAQVRQYGIEEGMGLSGALYEEICRETLLPQAKKRVLNLLIAKDRSRRELLGKLSDDGYPEEVCTMAVEYAQGYHYVDDLRYAVTYLRAHGEEKSRIQLFMKLKEKGIPREVADEAFETVRAERMELYGEEFEEAEITALRRQIAKKVKDPAALSEKEAAKLMASLAAKGFSLRDIRDVLGTVVLSGGEF
ncbi:MAG: recombination regulator RecX [Lachnospiraceae bacterium]|nr:recombination regulator RecX [Lachnospiraceae bacterium]